jgi:S-adenosylmethionine hydrolase
MANITLLSDFGLQDASAASAKALLMQEVKDAVITDISHLVEPYHVQQAAYILNAAYSGFPEGSFHIILCDIFYDRPSRLVLCYHNKQYFLAPDNGILSLAFSGKQDGTWLCHEMEDTDTMSRWLATCGSIINIISNGKSPEQAGLNTYEINNRLTHWQPKVNNNSIECHVIHIDRFENVVINLTKSMFESVGRNRPFRIQFARNEISSISNHYNDVRLDDMLCRFNSAGYLEIAINRGKAASLLGLKLSKEQHLIYNSIKIVFE